MGHANTKADDERKSPENYGKPKKNRNRKSPNQDGANTPNMSSTDFSEVPSLSPEVPMEDANTKKRPSSPMINVEEIDEEESEIHRLTVEHTANDESGYISDSFNVSQDYLGHGDHNPDHMLSPVPESVESAEAEIVTPKILPVVLDVMTSHLHDEGVETEYDQDVEIKTTPKTKIEDQIKESSDPDQIEKSDQEAMSNDPDKGNYQLTCDTDTSGKSVSCDQIYNGSAGTTMQNSSNQDVIHDDLITHSEAKHTQDKTESTSKERNVVNTENLNIGHNTPDNTGTCSNTEDSKMDDLIKDHNENVSSPDNISNKKEREPPCSTPPPDNSAVHKHDPDMADQATEDKGVSEQTTVDGQDVQSRPGEYYATDKEGQQVPGEVDTHAPETSAGDSANVGDAGKDDGLLSDATAKESEVVGAKDTEPDSQESGITPEESIVDSQDIKNSADSNEDSQSGPKESHIDSQSGSKESQIDSPSVPEESQIDSQSGANESQIDSQSGPNESQIYSQSGPNESQIDSQSGPNESQIDSQSEPNDSQIDEQNDSHKPTATTANQNVANDTMKDGPEAQDNAAPSLIVTDGQEAQDTAAPSLIVTDGPEAQDDAAPSLIVTDGSEAQDNTAPSLIITDGPKAQDNAAPSLIVTAVSVEETDGGQFSAPVQQDVLADTNSQQVLSPTEAPIEKPLLVPGVMMRRSKRPVSHANRATVTSILNDQGPVARAVAALVDEKEEEDNKTRKSVFTDDVLPGDITNINAVIEDDTGNTKLHVAALEFDTEGVASCLKSGANVNKVNRDYRTALHELTLSYVYADAYEQALHHKDFIEIVKTLSKAQIDMNQTDLRGNTALHYVVGLKYQQETIKELVTYGCRINIGDNKRQTSLHLAVLKGDYETVQTLLDSGGDSNQRDAMGQSSLHMAAFGKQHAEIIDLLVQNGANVDLQDRGFRTPLHIAAKYGRVENVEALLRNGASVFAQEGSGQTPLHLAAAKDSTEKVVNMLLKSLEKGKLEEYLNFQEPVYGDTALHKALRYRKMGNARCLCKYNLNPNIPNHNKDTPGHIAATYKDIVMWMHLGNIGTNFYLEDNNGMTILQKAQRFNNDVIVKCAANSQETGRMDRMENEFVVLGN